MSQMCVLGLLLIARRNLSQVNGIVQNPKSSKDLFPISNELHGTETLE